MRRRIQHSRLVAVVDEDDEPAAQTPGGIADPVDRLQVDLGTTARFERDAEPLQIILERRRRRGALARRHLYRRHL